MRLALTMMVLLCVSSGWAQPLQWSSLTPIITSAIQQQVSPSAVAIVGNLTTLFYALASGSKIVGATTAAAFLYQDGLLDINAKVSHYLGEAFNANGKANVTVLNCLLHDAGFPPDPSPLYYSPQF